MIASIPCQSVCRATKKILRGKHVDMPQAAGIVAMTGWLVQSSPLVEAEEGETEGSVDDEYEVKGGNKEEYLKCVENEREKMKEQFMGEEHSPAGLEVSFLIQQLILSKGGLILRPWSLQNHALGQAQEPSCKVRGCQDVCAERLRRGANEYCQ